MGIHLTIKANTELVKQATNSAIERALEAVGLKCEAYAKLACPVDTGLLRNSITHAVAGHETSITSYQSNNVHADTPATRRAGTANKPVEVKTGSYQGTVPDGKAVVYVGTNVEYAPYVEKGTQRTAAQPFLKPAIENHAEEYKAIIEKYLRGNA